MSDFKGTFFDRLFAGTIQWVLHTTYTCDLGYVVKLLQTQHREHPQPDFHAGETAVFYHHSEKIALRSKTIGGRIPLRELKKNVLHPLDGQSQTFHAKLSLVCYKDQSETHYRLAVYSRNLEFNNCKDTALLFALRKGPQETESGRQLISYLEKLRTAAEDSGKHWLEQKPLCDEARAFLLHAELISELDGKPAELFFGGCGDTFSLGERLGLQHATPKSLVLTPPEFLRGTHAWDDFQSWKQNQNGPQLCDLQGSGASSHCKLYLLETPERDPRYTLWTGSANASARGLGWLPDGRFSNDPQSASVECLVCFTLTREEFERMRQGILAEYAPFSFDSEATGSLRIVPDAFGPWMCARYFPTAVRYLDQTGQVCTETANARRIVVSLQARDTGLPKPSDTSQCVWRPAEYKTPQPCQGVPDGETVELAYSLEKFSKSQGMLLFGPSCSVMWLPHELLKDIPMVHQTTDRDTRLTDWLLSRDELADVSPDLDFDESATDGRAKLYYHLLTDKDATLPTASPAESGTCLTAEPHPGCLPSSQDADRLLAEHPMPFQRNAAARIVEILRHNSRAFLADEAGLGKTYSAAAAVCRMAQEEWKRQSTPTPFYCLYVAPNKALLHKCAADFCSKGSALLASDEKILTPSVSPKAALQAALKGWYGKTIANDCQKIKDRYEKEIKKAVLTRPLLEDSLLEQTLQSMGKSPEKIAAVREWAAKERAANPHYNSLRLLKSAVNKTGIGSWGSVFKKEYIKHACNCLFQKECSDLTAALNKELAEILDRLENANDRVKGWSAAKFIYSLQKKYRLKSWEDLACWYNRNALSPDRLVYHRKWQMENSPAGKTIVLLTVSASCLLDESTSAEEQELLGGKSRTDFTKQFLQEGRLQMIIWDEFHRYTTKLSGNPVYNVLTRQEADTTHPLHSLFLSATPYRTNISGKENSKVLDELYRGAKNNQGQDAEEEQLTQLPSFEAFAQLFCDGAPKPSCEKTFQPTFAELCQKYRAFAQDPQDSGKRTALQELLRHRMIRHERTQLQGALEPHKRLYRPESLYTSFWEKPLRNTMAQSRALEAAGFSAGDRRWSLSLPWILSFYKQNKRSSYKPSDHQRMDPGGKQLVDSPALFVYDNAGQPIPQRLQTLPEQNLPFAEICRENLQEEMTQLLWVPPTVPLYDPGTDSIFRHCRDYSKLLVFSEYQYHQKGGALLLSDYAALQNGAGLSSPAPSEFPALAYTGLDPALFDPTEEDYRDKSLDDLLNTLKEKHPNLDPSAALALIASPAVCAQRLGLDPQKVEEAFNQYFNRDGIRQALWKWLCNHGYEKDPVLGILRYCAEGNLYAVLEEWCFVEKEPNTDTLCELLVPRQHFAQVTVNCLERLQKEPAPEDAGQRRTCSFADRLTGDTGDVESGDDEAAITACAGRFSSPFWPMVLFAGRGAQEGMDFHQYCLRILHLTIPRGAVSFDQRNGRIDRFRSLLVRRRAAECLQGISCGESGKALLRRMFAFLTENRGQASPQDQLYPNWHIPVSHSRHHFEQIFPAWEFTEEYAALQICDAMLESYRRPFGTSQKVSRGMIDLRAPDAKN